MWVCVYIIERIHQDFLVSKLPYWGIFNNLPILSGPLFPGCCQPWAMSCSLGQPTLYPHLTPWELQIPFLLPSPSHRHDPAWDLFYLWQIIGLSPSALQSQPAVLPHALTQLLLLWVFLLHPDFQLLLSPYAAKTSQSLEICFSNTPSPFAHLLAVSILDPLYLCTRPATCLSLPGARPLSAAGENLLLCRLSH